MNQPYDPTRPQPTMTAREERAWLAMAETRELSLLLHEPHFAALLARRAARETPR